MKPEDVEWVVSSADSSAKDAGKVSEQEGIVPECIPVSFGPEGKDESGMLIDGDVDALFHAAEPKTFTEGHPKIRRLFADSRKTEHDHYARTGIFPIMHAVALRNDVIDAYPRLPEAVYNAYSQAKQMQYVTMRMQWIFGTLPGSKPSSEKWCSKGLTYLILLQCFYVQNWIAMNPAIWIPSGLGKR